MSAERQTQTKTGTMLARARRVIKANVVALAIITPASNVAAQGAPDSEAVTVEAIDAVADALANIDSHVEHVEIFVRAAAAANQSKGLAAFADVSAALAGDTTSGSYSADIAEGYETVENYGSNVRIALARGARAARESGLEWVAGQLHRGMSCIELRDTADSEIKRIRSGDAEAIASVADALDRCLSTERPHFEGYAGLGRRKRRDLSDDAFRNRVVERISSRPRDAIRLALSNLQEAVNAAQQEIVHAYNEVP